MWDSNLNLLCVTFTGADENTDLSALVKLQDDFKRNIEFGILVDPSKTGQPRYPNGNWIRRFLKVSRPDTRFALHLCGDAIPMFIKGDRTCIDLAHQFQRIQLNITAITNKPTAQKLIQAADAFYKKRQTVDPHKLGGVVIIPINPKTKDIGNEIAGAQIARYKSSHQNQSVPITFLMDDSEGRGATPEYWPDPVEHICCGYAGGINLKNVFNVNNIVRNRVAGNIYWLDLETGARTFIGPDDKDGVFDIGKCRAVMDELGFEPKT